MGYARHRDCLKEPEPEPAEPQEPADAGHAEAELVQLARNAAVQRVEDSVLARRTKERYAEARRRLDRAGGDLRKAITSKKR